MRTAAILELSNTYIQLSNWERAEALTSSIEDNNIKVIAIRELAYAYTSMQYWEQAERQIKSIENREVRITALCDLGTAYAQAQLLAPAKILWDEAHMLAASEDYDSYLAILRRLSASYAQTQLWDEVGRIRDEINTLRDSISISGEQSNDFYELSTTCIQAQLWDHAEEFIRAIQNPGVRIVAWRDLGMAYARARLRDRASAAWDEVELLIWSIRSGFERSKQLDELVTTYMQAGWWDRVEAIIPSIKDRTAYIKTLVDLGIAYSGAQFHDRARVAWNRVEADVYAMKESDARNTALLRLSAYPNNLIT